MATYGRILNTDGMYTDYPLKRLQWSGGVAALCAGQDRSEFSQIAATPPVVQSTQICFDNDLNLSRWPKPEPLECHGCASFRGLSC